jgi:hypothetical protein
MSNQQHTTVRCRASLSCMAEPPETYSVESCRFCHKMFAGYARSLSPQRRRGWMNSASLSMRLAFNLKTKNAPTGFLKNPTALDPVCYFTQDRP